MLLSVVVIMVNVASSAGEKGPALRNAQLAYLDQVRPHIERSTSQGADLVKVREEAGRLGSDGVSRQLDRLTRESEEVLSAVKGVEPPETLSTAHSLLVAAMAVRARAVSELGQGLTQGLGVTTSTRSALDSLSRVGDEIVAADQTYRVFLDSLPSPERLGAPAMPTSRWAGDVTGPGQWSRAELGALLDALRAGATSAVVHDVAVVVVRTDPAPVSSEAGASVLPLVRSLRLDAVVANTGNQVERRVPVVATIKGPSGMDTARDLVDLAPAQRRVVTLALRPLPGGPSELSVVAGPLPDEGAIADNGFSMSVLLRG